MRVSFVAVCEVTPEFLSMVKILLFSFRKNAGIYSNAPFTLVNNGKNLEKSEINKLKERFAPLEVITMPRLGGAKQNNKFNSFYAVDPSSYDVLVYLDCDTVILGPLDKITNNVDLSHPFLKASQIGKKGNSSVNNYEKLIIDYCSISKSNLGSIYNKDFKSNYPLFNSGVIVINKDAVLKMREDVLKIAYDLYQKKLKPMFPGRLIKTFIHNTYLNTKKSKRNSYKIWMTEQLAFSLAMIKNDVNYQLLEREFNFMQLIKQKDDPLPSIFHYMGVKYEIGIRNLFLENWYESYLGSAESPLSELAMLVKMYKEQYQDI